MRVFASQLGRYRQVVAMTALRLLRHASRQPLSNVVRTRVTKLRVNGWLKIVRCVRRVCVLNHEAPRLKRCNQHAVPPLSLPVPVRRRQRRPSCAHPPVSSLRLQSRPRVAAASSHTWRHSKLPRPNLFKSRLISRAQLPRCSASSALTPASNDAQPQNTCASITGVFPQNQTFACFTRDILDALRTSDFSSDCSPDNTAR